MLSQTGIYALRAMSFLAGQDGETPVLSATIAEEMNIPKNFLSKILNRLVQSGLVISMRGRQGGFVLAKPAQEITVRNVVDLFMKLDDFKKCFLVIDTCKGTCGFHKRWAVITDQCEKMLDETSIAEVF